MDKNRPIAKAWYFRMANFQEIEKSVNEDDRPEELNDFNALKDGFTLRM